jgi:hypothetical protein
MASPDSESSMEQIEIFNSQAIDSIEFAHAMLNHVIRNAAGYQYEKYLRAKCPQYLIQTTLDQISLQAQVTYSERH